MTGVPALSTARLLAADIKLAHSVFALPFAVLAAFLAAVPPAGGSVDWPRLLGQLALVVLAMVFARTAAMLANRILDRRIDAGNPRTAGRALPSGQVSAGAAVSVWAACVAGFLMVCLLFWPLYGNWLPAALAVPVIAWICAYALLKRFTVLCHLYLGSSLAISPVAAAIAVHPAALGEQAGPWLLGLMVLCWVAGFDVIYALQDVEVDRRDGLHSMPSRLGVPAAMWWSRCLHVLAAGSLIALAWIDPRLGGLFAAAVAATCGLLVVEHLTVARWGTTRLALSFFTINGLISCLLGLAGAADVIAR